MKLEGKSIVVTGAVAGIGNAITELFANEGANIIAVDKQEERLLEFCASMDAPGKVVAFPGDVSFQETTDGMIDAAVREFGRFDVLVNNAGIMDDNTAIGDMSDAMMEECFAVNAMGPMRAMRKAVQTFIELNPDAEEDEDTIGSIINLTSVGAVHQTAGAAYCASKGALLSATKNTAFMYIHKGIRCNAIAPGRHRHRDSHHHAAVGSLRVRSYERAARSFVTARHARGHRERRALPCAGRVALREWGCHHC